jgi:hypothetical protein
MIAKIYKILLFILGFPEGLTITKMLRNQKERFGVWWWFLSGGTVAGLIALILHVIGLF